MSIRVLVVDPDESFLEAYEISLRKYQLDVYTVSNGSDCLEKLREHLPHVLVLEADLPGDEAKRLIELMRDSTHLPTVPVVIVSHVKREQLGIPFRFPVWAFYSKPVEMDELAKAIRCAAQKGPVKR